MRKVKLKGRMGNFIFILSPVPLLYCSTLSAKGGGPCGLSVNSVVEDMFHTETQRHKDTKGRLRRRKSNR